MHVFYNKVCVLLDDSNRDLDTFERSICKDCNDNEPLDAQGVCNLFESLWEEERVSIIILDANSDDNHSPD